MANLNQNTNSFRDVGHIVKFNGDNHLDWKYEFLGMMEQLGLKNLIEPAVAGGQVLTLPIEEREADGPITNQAAIDSWHQKDVSVRNYILATLEQSQKQNLYGIPTAREMWLNISTQYTTRADEIEGQLLQDMWSYKYDPARDIRGHINGILSISNKLREMGNPVQEKYVISKMLSSLPASFWHARSSWTNVPRPEQTISNLTQRLLAEEKVIASYTTAPTTTAANPGTNAFKATTDQNQDAAYNAAGPSTSGYQRGGYRGRRGFGGRRGQGPFRGGVNQHAHRERDAANLETAQRIWECIFCELDSHKTVDCRKLKKARELSKQPKEDTGFPASACYSTRSIFDWFADSGATSHMTDQRSLIFNYKPVTPGSWMVTGIGGATLPVHGQGQVSVLTEGEVESERIISPVLHVPDLGTNLFSIVSATEAGMKAIFNGNKVNIFTPDASIYMEGDRAGRTMYHLRIRSLVNIDRAASATSTGQLSPPTLWHCRIGHVNLRNLKRMQTQGLVQGLDFNGSEEEWEDLQHS
uniref:GAG-pre-integrase domain-containing protein n=1 Tax=Daphnia galeata TaxID=27404 RepID=A0A8J2WLN9_9CRUS|nr:unnamed protein product [Daphnia galeata]